MNFEISDIFSLKGTISLVTGSTGLLGKEIALALCEKGSHVILHGRNPDKVNILAKELSEKGYKVDVAIFDLSDYTQIENYFKNFTFSKLNILVNNAYKGKAGSIETSSVADFDSSINLSVTSCFAMIKEGQKFLKNSPKGEVRSIINITSMYGMVAPDFTLYEDEKFYNPPFYGAGKAGLIQLTKYAAANFAKDEIRVNSLSLGPFPSKEALTSVKLSSGIKRNSLMGRSGNPNEVKGPILFLASNASSYMTGSNLVVDGGWTSK